MGGQWDSQALPGGGPILLTGTGFARLWASQDGAWALPSALGVHGGIPGGRTSAARRSAAPNFRRAAPFPSGIGTMGEKNNTISCLLIQQTRVCGSGKKWSVREGKEPVRVCGSGKKWSVRERKGMGMRVGKGMAGPGMRVCGSGKKRYGVENGPSSVCGSGEKWWVRGPSLCRSGTGLKVNKTINTPQR